MKKSTLLSVAVIIVAVGLVWYAMSGDDSSTEIEDAQTGVESQYPAVPGTPEMIVSDETATPNDASGAAGGIEKVRGFTLAEVEKHNTVSDCYAIVRDGVYDLTTWISKHPGGEKAILSICGKDGTAAFEGVHDGKEKQEAQLLTFYVGEYIKE